MDRESSHDRSVTPTPNALLRDPTKELQLPPASPAASAQVSSTARNLGLGNDHLHNGSHLPSLQQQVQDSKELTEDLRALLNQLQIEQKVKDGAENMLQVVFSTGGGHGHGHGGHDGQELLRKQVESELSAANAKISALTRHIERLQAKSGISPDRPRRPSDLLTCYFDRHMSSTTPFDTPDERGQQDEDDNSLALASIRESLRSLGQQDAPADQVETLGMIVQVAKRITSPFVTVPIHDTVEGIIPCLSDQKGKDVRAAAYRALRFLVKSASEIQDLREANLDLYLVKTFVRDHQCEYEKQQALRLLRSFFQLPDGTKQVSPAVLRGVVAIAENPEERLRIACLQTLGELVIRDIEVLYRSEGLRVVLQSLAEIPPELVEFPTILSMAFLHAIDRPCTRQFLKPGLDIEMAFSALNAPQGKQSSSQNERLRSSARMMTMFVKSWSGLFYLCLNGKQTIESLVDALKIPSAPLRSLLLDTLFDIFSIETPGWYTSFLAGKRLTLYRNKPPATFPNDTIPLLPKADPDRRNNSPNLLDHHLALLLLVFFDAGLLDVLITIAEDKEKMTQTRQAWLLISELLQLSARVLPSAYGAHLQALPRLFELASSFKEDDLRLSAMSILRSVESLTRNRTRLQTSAPTKDLRARSNSLDDPIRRAQRQQQLDPTRVRAPVQIDDTSFRNLLVDTQVLTTKEFSKWNFDTLMALFEGPLLNARRLEEAMRGTKFIRRLMSFYHPFNNRFADIRQTKHTTKWIQLGCTMLTTLLNSPDGIRYLSEDKLLHQIADCLVQLETAAGSSSSEALFSKHRLEDRLTSGYFDMLGTLSRSPEGVKLMEQSKIFTLFYHLSDLRNRNREDVVRLIIEKVDYETEGHARIVLSKALTSPNKHVRIFATRHLGHLIRTSISPSEWRIQLLLTQLYDPAPEVCELAVQILDEACEVPEVLESVVQLRPSLDHLGNIGAPLLIRFLSSSIGVQYLHEINYIDREMEDWFHERNYLYVVQLELYLASALNVAGTRGDEESKLHNEFDGTVPPHFYGELVKTDEGRAILAQKGHFMEFAEFIRMHGLDDGEDLEIIAHLKSVLWAVGHIGSTEEGLQFLEEEGVVQSIVDIAEMSPIYSVRGTAFFVLGLVSSTQQGVELLEDYGWETACTPVGRPTGLCVPVDLDRFISTDGWNDPDPSPPPNIPLPTNPHENEVQKAIMNLSNHILATGASRTLTKLKGRSSHNHVFTSPTMFARALEIIGGWHYRGGTRRYIVELFDGVAADREGVDSVAVLQRTLRSSHRDASETLAKSNGARADGEHAEAAGADVNPPRPKLATGLSGLDGKDAFVGSDSEQEDEGDVDGKLMPKEVLEPLIVLKGFLLGQ